MNIDQDLAIIQDQLSKVGIQEPVTITISDHDYRDLEIKCKVSPDWWKHSQFMDNHFTWMNLTFRRASATGI